MRSSIIFKIQRRKPNETKGRPSIFAVFSIPFPIDLPNFSVQSSSEEMDGRITQPVTLRKSFQVLNRVRRNRTGSARRLPAGKPGRETGILAAFRSEGITMCHSPFPEGRNPSQFPQTPSPIPWPKNAPQGMVLHAVKVFIHLVCQ